MSKPALTNEESRRRHVKLPTKVLGKSNFRQGRGQTSMDRRYAKRMHGLTRRLVDAIKLGRGCESGCCPVHGEFFPEDLAFHHCVGKKKGEVSKIKSSGAALAEIEKCLVLCHICHGRVHRGRIDLAEAILRRWPNGVPAEPVAEESDDGQLRLFG